MKSKEEILAKAEEKGVKFSKLNELIGGYRGKITEWKNGKTTLSDSELHILTEYLFDDTPSVAEEWYNRYSRLSDAQKKIVDSLFDQFESDK
jgi:hypothetical protein